MAFQFRYAMSSPAMSPPWLTGNGSNGSKFMYTIGNSIDFLLEKMNEAQLAKCPGHADASLLPFQANDRVMVQGPDEPDASFIIRLRGAFDAWARAGARSAILGQIQAYLTGLQPGVALNLPECLIVGGNTSTSIWDTIFRYMPQGAAPAHKLVDPANWDWDGQNRPSRAWLILFMNLVDVGISGAAATVASTGGSGVVGVTSGFATIGGLADITSDQVQQYITLGGCATSANNGTFQIVAVPSSSSVIVANTGAVAPDANDGSITWSIAEYPFIGPAPVWGSPDFVWGDDFTWGVNCSTDTIQSIRQILSRWKSAQTYYPNIIIAFGGGDGTAGNEFSPYSSEGSGNPDGTWGTYGKNVGGCVVPARQSLNPFTVCCDGTGLALSCFEKNVT